MWSHRLLAAALWCHFIESTRLCARIHFTLQANAYRAEYLHTGVEQLPGSFMVDCLRLVVDHGVLTHDSEIHLYQ